VAKIYLEIMQLHMVISKLIFRQHLSVHSWLRNIKILHKFLSHTAGIMVPRSLQKTHFLWPPKGR